ncbi:uncharacterized protein BP01DRAFT_361147 [Aspergillus saccharolyticus JOP 1030-1]|uniref:Uncharacterized protein n=1 Tax=Aspergillus saccharolyticus JOP 1030-1 TaxID=1450539 RepID=A0A318YZW8_9EURO|nr:hypothetical protein BP01DRAFT_361147 [Aspergillus saccharolyticus JOP 1030-1]PYH40561.1 hypothetical protein BP01DRAFT_361147 [Aspergillus saccharolyticus JOP 1030-1]
MSSSTEFFRIPAAVIRRTAPRLSSTLAPLANRPAIPGKLAAISRGKLQRETESQTPDLRRCLGHHHIFRRCVAAEEEDNARYRRETYFDDDDLDGEYHHHSTNRRHNSESTPIRTQITKAVKAMVRRRDAENNAVPDNGLVRMASSRASEKQRLSIKHSRHHLSLFGLRRLIASQATTVPLPQVHVAA